MAAAAPNPTRANLTPDPPRAAGGKGRRRIGPALIGVLVGLLVLAGGATAVTLMTRAGTPSIAAPATTPTTTAPPTPAATTSAPAPATTPPSAAPSSAPAAATADPVGFVQNYYGLLPGNTDAAFAMLGPGAVNESGGRQSFVGFWNTIQSVTLQDARSTGVNAVSGRVHFVRKDGTVSDENYTFVVGTNGDGKTLLQTFSRA